jgi:hypothetical protein
MSSRLRLAQSLVCCFSFHAPSPSPARFRCAAPKYSTPFNRERECIESTRLVMVITSLAITGVVLGSDAYDIRRKGEIFVLELSALIDFSIDSDCLGSPLSV